MRRHLRELCPLLHLHSHNNSPRRNHHNILHRIRLRSLQNSLLHIRFYIGLWAEFCAISFKQSDYYKEEHTWKEWYAIAQKNYRSEPEERQAKLLDAYHSQLLSCVKIINHSIEKIQSQSYVLAVNETMDQQLENILNDLQAEFSTLEKELTSENDANYFWSHTDAIHSNLERKIENWEDTKHYNHKQFKPYNVFNLREP